MVMKVEAKDGSNERRTLIACCSSSQFLARAVGRVGKDPFRSKWSNLVWSWCVQHHIKYQQAPGNLIQDYYVEWCEKSQDKELKSVLERFLISLSTQAEKEEEINVEFALDLAEKLLNEVAMERLLESLTSSLDKSDIESALQTRESFKKVNLHS